MRFESFSRKDTAMLAADLAKNAKPGDILCLTGSLGAGKTVFAQGFAEELGFAGAVTSPTFTLMNVYEGGRLPLYHFDLYRLTDEDGLMDTGYEDYLDGDGVCLIEWPERAASSIPETAIWIRLSRVDGKDGDYRIIETETPGHGRQTF